ncbi:LPS-assembly protein LptD [Candidatus Entotheonellaceae bacterium PAL068K]
MIARLFMIGVLLGFGQSVLLPAVGSGADTEQQVASGAAVGPEPTGLILRAETLDYYTAEHRLVAAGNVSVMYGNTRVFADRLEVNTDTGTGTAWGQVRLLTPEDDVQASRLDFNLTTEHGLLYDGVGVVTGVYHVAGKRITRLGPKSFEVQRGRVTTCTAHTPDWEFRARETQIGLGDYVTLTHPSFWIKGVPVFYLPYFIFPLKDERTSGFLPPHVGYSGVDGAVVETRFYWAMADWMDATVGLEYLSEKGVKPEVEYRYAIDPQSDGRLEAALIREQDTDNTLWRVFIQQRQEFGWDMRGLTQIDLRSDDDLLRRFSRDLRTESMVHTASFSTLTKRFANSALTVLGESFDGIPDSGFDQQFRRLPALRFSQFPTPLFGLAFFAVDASYSRLNATEIVDNTSVQRLDLFPRLTIPLHVAPWMQFTVTGGVHETFYDHKVERASNLSRHLVDVRTHLQGPAWRRRYERADAPRAFIHLIETRLAYRYAPEVDQDDIPPFEVLNQDEHFLDPLETDSLVDRILPANYVKVLLSSRLFVVGSDPGTSPQVREVAHLGISQGFDMQRATQGDGTLPGPFELDMALRLLPRWRLDSAYRLNPLAGALQASNIRLGFVMRPGWTVRAAHQYRQDPDVQYLSGGLRVTPLKGLQVGYDMRFDGLTGTLRSHLISFSYVAQCWSVDGYLRIRNTEDTPFFASTSFFIQFNLFHF